MQSPLVFFILIPFYCLIFTIPQSPNQANKPNYSSKPKENVHKKQWKKVPVILPVSDIRRKQVNKQTYQH
jgi:hypothetical protein